MILMLKLNHLDKRITDLEKFDKPILKKYDGGKYFYTIKNFGIPFERLFNI